MNYKPSFTEISSNEIQSWVNYGNPGETTKQAPTKSWGFLFPYNYRIERLILFLSTSTSSTFTRTCWLSRTTSLGSLM